MIRRMKVKSDNYCKTKFVILVLILIGFPLQGFSKDHVGVGNNTWNSFRKVFNEPFRAIACENKPDGSRVYIISEPPEDIEIDDVEHVFEGFVHYCWTKKYQIGYDGWVKDIVIYTYAIPDFCHKRLIIELNKLIFGDAYKAWYIPLPYNKKRSHFFSIPTLGASINDGDLYSWIIEEDISLSNIKTDEKTSYSKIIRQSKTGVYLSSDDRLVLWAFKDNTALEREKVSMHCFFLESDLVLGGIKAGDLLILVGRKRQLGLSEYAPLREDDVLLLAAAKGFVGQSLDMGEPIYGKLNGEYDWCPAWVSNSIMHTEYAYLLTITDVYLKHWLVNLPYKAIGYESIIPVVAFDYLIPNSYSVRFNWNTKDFAYISSYDDCKILTASNTSCLSCSLFERSKESKEEKELYQIQEKAYAYMLDLGNTSIARVAQYTLLYEFLHYFNVKSSENNVAYNEHADNYLSSQAFLVFNKIKHLTDAEIDNIIKSIYKEQIEPQINRLSDNEKVVFMSDDRHVIRATKGWNDALKTIAEEEAKKNGLSYGEYIKTAAYFQLKQKVDDKIKKDILFTFDYQRQSFEEMCCNDILLPEIEALRAYLQNIPTNQLKKYSQYVANPHRYVGDDVLTLQSLDTDIWLVGFTFLKYPSYFGFDVKNVLSEYVSRARVNQKRWIKSPSLLVCNNFQSMVEIKKCFGYESRITVGGHSIDLSITSKLSKAAPKDISYLSFTGDPLNDAVYYGERAVNASTFEEEIFFIRKSKEALSQPYKNQKKNMRDDRLDEMLERALAEAIQQSSKINNAALYSKQRIKDDYNTIETYIDNELNEGENLSYEQRQSYTYLKNFIKNEKEIIDEMPEDVEDEEIKMLRRKLRNLQLTLAELKRS